MVLMAPSLRQGQEYGLNRLDSPGFPFRIQFAFLRPVAGEMMNAMMKLFAGIGAALSLTATSAYAAQPSPWEMRFQPAATEIMRQIAWFEEYTLWFIVPITVLVLVLLAYCIVRFRASANPTPSRVSHNTLIE